MLQNYPKPAKRKPEPVTSETVVCPDTILGNREYKMRIHAMWTRQDATCAYCRLTLRYDEATFDHEAGRGLGGGHRDDRIEVDGRWHNAALHYACNGKKGSRRYRWQDGRYLPNERTKP